MAQHPVGAAAGRHTGWAIGAAISLSLVFYLLYRLLFSFVVAAYASYDPSFATGLGALLLLVIGPNVLGVLSGAVVAKTMFKQASRSGLFYGVATFMVVVGGLAITAELIRPDGSVVPVLILAITVAGSILAARVVLIYTE